MTGALAPGAEPMRGDDAAVVRSEYADETGLRSRASVYGGAYGGEDPVRVALEAVREAAPSRVLEVGCGWGEFAEAVRSELGAEVVAVDQSERMVALTAERGIDARLGDVQALLFEDASFDCAVANWMLYHVADLDRGLAELARVLRPGGRLVATTNGLRHLGELWDLVGRDRSSEPERFFAESGERSLRAHFPRVERRDLSRPVTFRDTEAARAYVASSVLHKHLASRLPELEGPLVATSCQTVFVAEKAP